MYTWLSTASTEAHTGWLTGVLLDFARGGAEWVLWLLVAMSLLSVAIFAERIRFLAAHKTDGAKLRLRIIEHLGRRDIDGALKGLEDVPSMEGNVVAYGLREAERGPEAVLELCRGAMGVERIRYDRGLTVLATIGSNAPFVGLFGTVMGVIMAFDGLSSMDGTDASQSSVVMGAIAEALIATGVGLLVAIPAIIFFNMLRGMVKKRVSQTQLLVETMVAYLREDRSAPSVASDTD